jgi:hypothetical protein
VHVQANAWSLCVPCLLQLPQGLPLSKTSMGRLCCDVGGSVLTSAFDDTWQQRGFKVVQLSVSENGSCIAAGRLAMVLSMQLASYS